jgi:hypothetical protein
MGKYQGLRTNKGYYAKLTKWQKFYDWVMNPKNKKEYYDSEDKD